MEWGTSAGCVWNNGRYVPRHSSHSFDCEFALNCAFLSGFKCETDSCRFFVGGAGCDSATMRALPARRMPQRLRFDAPIQDLSHRPHIICRITRTNLRSTRPCLLRGVATANGVWQGAALFIVLSRQTSRDALPRSHFTQKRTRLPFMSRRALSHHRFTHKCTGSVVLWVQSLDALHVHTELISNFYQNCHSVTARHTDWVHHVID